MNTRTAQLLAQTNRRFYDENAASFSVTRTHGWEGWERVVVRMRSVWGPDDARLVGEAPLRVLDVACGNLRFERFLVEQLPHARIETTGVDACAALLPPAAAITFIGADIIEALLTRTAAPFPPRPFDLVVCFGFFHHVPGQDARQRLLTELLAATAPNGICALSLWRFMDDPRAAEKNLRFHEGARASLETQANAPLDLEPGDYLIGWQGKPSAVRYCHSFSDVDVDDLAAYGTAYRSLADRFRADSHTHAANEYLVFG